MIITIQLLCAKSIGIWLLIERALCKITNNNAQ
jgi:hypothetical protein